jgi:hypothetical protein
MNLIFISAAVLFAIGAIAQTPNSATPPTLERLCGNLQQMDLRPIEGQPHSFAYEVRKLRHVAVSLYAADDNRQCCEGISPLATVQTGHWASFQFKTKSLPPGMYWVQVEPEGRRYQILIRYAPKKHSDQQCYQTCWDVDDSGNFRERTQRTITVD